MMRDPRRTALVPFVVVVVVVVEPEAKLKRPWPEVPLEKHGSPCNPSLDPIASIQSRAFNVHPTDGDERGLRGLPSTQRR